MSLAAVNAITAPRGQDVHAVVSFLKENNVVDYDISSGFLRTTVSVEVAEKMLGTTYAYYRHAKTNLKALRCESYTLPEIVASALDFVSPTGTFLLHSW